uniref:Peptidase S1 domain-containing protein n=1 Tax=Anopheles epiroticus TaxID=199890 RepID=A0A182PN66_9DIPT
MKSVSIICVSLLVLSIGNVLANRSSETENEVANASEETTPGPKQLGANNSSYSGRIINGQTGDISSFPYTVRLRVTNGSRRSVCGATIITWWHAFTAAHCVYNNPNPAGITLQGGSTSQYRGGVFFYASKILIHPNYDPQTYDYDAAIIEVENTFQGYTNVAPVPLQNEEVPVGTSCTAAGWGLIDFDTQTSPENLQYAQFQVVSQQQCSSAYGYVSPQVICVYRGNGVDMCKGDSGGPLVCNGKLTGATSFGGRGCRARSPAGFTKVMASSIRQFILENAGI